MTQDTPYAKAIHRMDQAAACAQVQTQLPFMHTEPEVVVDEDDALHFAETPPGEASTESQLADRLGIPVDLQHVLLVWVTVSVKDDMTTVATMTEAEIRRCFHRFLARTMGTMSLADLRA